MAKLRLLKTGHGDLTLAEWDKDRPETIVAAEAAFAENCHGGAAGISSRRAGAHRRRSGSSKSRRRRS